MKELKKAIENGDIVSLTSLVETSIGIGTYEIGEAIASLIQHYPDDPLHLEMFRVLLRSRFVEINGYSNNHCLPNFTLTIEPIIFSIIKNNKKSFLSEILKDPRTDVNQCHKFNDNRYSPLVYADIYDKEEIFSEILRSPKIALHTKDQIVLMLSDTANVTVRPKGHERYRYLFLKAFTLVMIEQPEKVRKTLSKFPETLELLKQYQYQLFDILDKDIVYNVAAEKYEKLLNDACNSEEHNADQMHPLSMIFSQDVPVSTWTVRLFQGNNSTIPLEQIKQKLASFAPAKHSAGSDMI